MLALNSSEADLQDIGCAPAEFQVRLYLGGVLALGDEGGVELLGAGVFGLSAGNGDMRAPDHERERCAQTANDPRAKRNHGEQVHGVAPCT